LPNSTSTGPCEGCAFSPGSITHDEEPHNNLRGQLCLLGGIVFYCHHAADGSLQNLKGMRMEERGRLVREGKLIVCQGWRREVATLSHEGYYREHGDIKRMYAELGLGALLLFTGEAEGLEKERARDLLYDVIMALNKARGFTEVVE
jgi:hypothetical protein